MNAFRVALFAATAGTLFIAATSLAQTPAPAAHAPSHEAVAPPGQAAAGAEVLAFERELAAALVRGDVAYMEKAIAPDFAMVHGDVAITYGHYVGHIPGSPEGRRWFSVWYEKVYAKRDGRWVYLSHRTVDGAHYGNDRASVRLH